MPSATIACPYCGEPFDVSLDETEGEQDLNTDCETCCRPLTVTATITDGGVVNCDATTE